MTWLNRVDKLQVGQQTIAADHSCSLDTFNLRLSGGFSERHNLCRRAARRAAVVSLQNSSTVGTIGCWYSWRPERTKEDG